MKIHESLGLQKQNIYFYLHKVDQSQQAHSSEVCFGIITLETNVTPLLGDSSLQIFMRHQQIPELHKHASMLHTMTIFLKRSHNS